MKNYKVIARKNLPSKLPIPSTVLTALALDYWNAPEWLWGVFSVVIGFLWIAVIVALFKQEQVDTFKD